MRGCVVQHSVPEDPTRELWLDLGHCGISLYASSTNKRSGCCVVSIQPGYMDSRVGLELASDVIVRRCSEGVGSTVDLRESSVPVPIRCGELG